MSTHVKVMAILVARPGKGGELQTLLDGMVAPSREEACNLRYDLWRDQTDPDRFVLDELYADKDAVAAHRASPHFQNYVSASATSRSVPRWCSIPPRSPDLRYLPAYGDKAMPRACFTLTDSDAQHMISAARTAANVFGVPYCIAVVDAGGNLLAFARQDDALIGCIDLAINKARTARLFDEPTADLGRMAQPGADLYGIQHSNRGDIVLVGGGLPVVRDGVVIGAVGASAGTVIQDIAVAEAALAPLSA